MLVEKTIVKQRILPMKRGGMDTTQGLRKMRKDSQSILKGKSQNNKDLEYKVCDLCGSKYPVISNCICFWKQPSKYNGR
jgi:hypothetical protein